MLGERAGTEYIRPMPLIEDKRLKRETREQAVRAHEAELRTALSALADSFAAWERGEIDSFELSDRVHGFHDGEARDLWNYYALSKSLEIKVARAINENVIARETVSPELLSALDDALELVKKLDRIDESQADERQST